MSMQCQVSLKHDQKEQEEVTEQGERKTLGRLLNNCAAAVNRLALLEPHFGLLKKKIWSGLTGQDEAQRPEFDPLDPT